MDLNQKDFIEKPRGVLNYVQGIQTLIPYYVQQPDGDWSEFLPTKEPQKYKFDTNGCMTLSAINIIEAQCNAFKAKGLFTPEALQYFDDAGYIDENGSFAFSERFSAILNGTSIDGNDFESVWQGFRHYGLLPRKDFYYSLEESNAFVSQQAMCWDYYNPSRITQAMKDKAMKIFDYIIIQWEWVVADDLMRPSESDLEALEKALEQAPVHIAIPACSDWNTGDVHSCGTNAAHHGTFLFNILISGQYDIRDQYNPYNKLLSADYPIPYAVKGLITINQEQREIQEITILQKLIVLLKAWSGSIFQ